MGGYSTSTGLPSIKSFGRRGTLMAPLTSQYLNAQRDLCLLSGLYGTCRVLQHNRTSLPVPTVPAPKIQDISTLQQKDNPKTFDLNTQNMLIKHNANC